MEIFFQNYMVRVMAESKSKPPSMDTIHQTNFQKLEATFVSLKAQAIASGMVNDCSLSKIAKETGVSSSYFQGEKPKKMPEIAKSYKKFADRVNGWRVEFQQNKQEMQDESEMGKLVSERDNLRNERNSAHLQCLELAATIERYRTKDDANKKRISTMNATAADIAFSNIQSKRSDVVFSSSNIVSPDKHLDIDGVYQFNNKALRDVAWERARHELIELLKRPLPTRVYLLIGMPGSGKSTWASKGNYFRDKHSVVIDATNLTKASRLNWLNIIMQEKYKNGRDISICGVLFDTPYSVLTERNAKHRKIDEIRLLELYETKENIELPSENFDEILVVRYE